MPQQTQNDTSRMDPQNSVSTVALVPGGPVMGTIRPPGSKSLTNRALICAALASGTSRITGALVSEDTEVMIDSLCKIGTEVKVTDCGRVITIDQTKTQKERGMQNAPVELYIANSGTSIRFLSAALSAIGGHYRLHGLPRMHERPIGDLGKAINSVISGSMLMESSEDGPPVLIHSDGWKQNELGVAGSVSSQYLSGLMMAAPARAIDSSTTPQTVTIQVHGELVSQPYVEMTASVMRAFGAKVELSRPTVTPDENLHVQIGTPGYQGVEYEIEPDASAASYFWAAAAITGGSVEVLGLTPNAIQGDVNFCQALRKMGCDLTIGSNSMTISGRAKNGIDIDMNEISDTVQTLCVVALFAEGPTRIRGVAHNRFKETDRIGDLACELRKLGADVQEHHDGLTVQAPRAGLKGTVLETYQDHRMAMSLSLAGLNLPGVRISNPSCTAKTYPNYFADMELLLGRPHHWHRG